jgi:RNA recognition motif-containing protein
VLLLTLSDPSLDAARGCRKFPLRRDLVRTADRSIRQRCLAGTDMNIFVGNLGPDVTEADVAELFKPFGQVESVQLMRELFTGKLRGFGFVEMPGKQHSLAAIAGLNGKEFAGRALQVNEARPRIERGRRR